MTYDELKKANNNKIVDTENILKRMDLDKFTTTNEGVIIPKEQNTLIQKINKLGKGGKHRKSNKKKKKRKRTRKSRKKH
tara:strand:- start:590 stop:826 length:237 start_codon:yes stop_codon:yes gene_type:complete